MDLDRLCAIGLLLLILNTLLIHGRKYGYATGGAAGGIQYDRDTLLLLRNHLSTDYSTVSNTIPECIRADPRNGRTRGRRKQGCRGGIRQ